MALLSVKMPKSLDNIFYVVLIGHTPGIYDTLEKYKEQVNNFPFAYYRKCLTLEKANEFFNNYQLKTKRKNEILNLNDKIVIYTDGSCKDNEKAELYTVIRAIETCENQDKVIEIKTDSRYVVNACEVWINNWKKNNWKTLRNKVVKNKDLFEKLDF
ncbi:32717_t:CDS:2 [Gigaspora margarita]|uniref:ribonuclease H n=1 Tax=Gigaspora margarita TaxID=4874 RepID=A0ABN7VU36_GIGMA|nr:32717_t:CDS:2 [Gigaspora margarita]